MTATVLEKCLATAEKASRREIASAEKKLPEIEKTIARAQETVSKLFGFEQGVKPAIEAQIAELERQKFRLQNLNKYGSYGCLSFEPLKWRNKKTGWPLLAVFSLDSPRFEISVKMTIRWRWSPQAYSDVQHLEARAQLAPKLPAPLASCYDDVVKTLQTSARRKRKSITLATEYIGAIPNEIRGKIHEAKGQFEDVFLIAEAGKWNLVEKKARVLPNPNEGDPLVVGWDGSSLWVIDSFDLTPIERFVKSEFTV